MSFRKSWCWSDLEGLPQNQQWKRNPGSLPRADDDI